MAITIRRSSPLPTCYRCKAPDAHRKCTCITDRHICKYRRMRARVLKTSEFGKCPNQGELSAEFEFAIFPVSLQLKRSSCLAWNFLRGMQILCSRTKPSRILIIISSHFEKWKFMKIQFFWNVRQTITKYVLFYKFCRYLIKFDLHWRDSHSSFVPFLAVEWASTAAASEHKSNFFDR